MAEPVFSVSGDAVMFRGEELGSPSDREKREIQLDHLLYAKAKAIIIRVKSLGEDTRWWISLGHWFQNTAVISGLGCAITYEIWPQNSLLICSWGLLSLLAGGIHALSWQTDPCSAYEVETNAEHLRTLLADSDVQNSTVTSVAVVGGSISGDSNDDDGSDDGHTPLVIVHSNKFVQNLVCNATVILAAWICGRRIYKWYIK
ncbi:transmembrane protein 11-B, mitochondrial [Octopus sinensis]|uniref:Transmembrane protein 11-B, mitochondrial n=1 Tax=Octopus sinensis TaxID=2607531 RepID=A0A6P7TS46_9MOLL|nr:transmembrane protein 11-B, mitochondrial [Octopus sinensis]